MTKSIERRGLNERTKKVNYPKTPQVPGDDPYHWLSEENEQTNDWVTQQNAFTRRYFGGIREREQIKQELKSLLETDTIYCPERYGENIFQWRRIGNQNQAVLHVKNAQTGKEEALLDPNVLSSDGTIAVDWTQPTKDGKFIAYGTSEGGTEKSVLKVREVASKKDLELKIPNTRACSIAWLPDNSGFYYTRYPQKGKVPEGEENYHRSVYFHKIGEDYSNDPLIMAPADPYGDWLNVDISEDGEWVYIANFHGWTSSDLLIGKTSPQSKNISFKKVFDGEGRYKASGAQVFGEHLYVSTDKEAPGSKIVRIELKNINQDVSSNSWEDVAPEEKGATLENFSIVGGKIVAKYLEKAFSRIDIINPRDKSRVLVLLPGIGSITDISGQIDQPQMYYKFESFATPPSIYTMDVNTRKQNLEQKMDVGEDLDGIETRQVVYNSKDGTPVTMFLVHKKGLQKDGRNKVVLTGYGGFGISKTPLFMKSFIPWFKKGGIFALPNLRGGAEYGEDWHRAGMLENKQNVFDDFIAAAEFLIKEDYTRKEKLGIQGGSNGGLLVGAALTQRPDLFGAVICAVPLLDMIHYDRTKIAKLWVAEYGDPNNPEHFKFLYKYSPYHNVKPQVEYPATLLMTAEGDTRVDPMHAKKMAARLQEVTKGGKPILLRVEDKAGHGIGKPLAKVLEEQADMFAFLDKELE